MTLSRVNRIVGPVAVVVCTLGAVFDAVIGQFALAALPFAFAVLNLVLLVASVRRARHGATASRRPDYARIATLEREIWGQAFEHDGAPEPKRPPSRSCPCGHAMFQAVDGDWHCRPCEEQRLTGADLECDAFSRTRQALETRIVNTFGYPPARVISRGCAWCHGPLTERWSCRRGSTNTTHTTGNMTHTATCAGGGGGSWPPPGESQSWTCCSQEHMHLLMRREGF